MYNKSPPGPEPDISSGMAALQMATSTSQTPSGRATPVTGAPRAKPTIPQKKNHIDELLRLRKDLEEMREERDQACGARDAMEDDLLKMQEEVDEKDEELKKMQEDVNKKDAELKKLSREVWAGRDMVDKLSKDLGVQGRRSFGGGGASSPGSRDTSGRNDTELAQARQQIQQLTAALAESKAVLSERASAVPVSEFNQQSSMEAAQREFDSRLAQVEDHWRSQVVEQQKLRQAAEGSLHGTREYYENKLRDVEMQARTQIEEQQRRLQEAETGLQGGLQRMEVDSGGNEELERLRRLAAEQEEKVNDQRQCAEQFRRMSERLTTQVKQANMAKRAVEQSEQAMRQQVEDMKAQMTSQRHNRMPGSFREY